MPQIEIFADMCGLDGIPHTFMKVYDNDGNVTEYGFVSKNGKMVDDGDIDVNVNHEFDVRSGKMEITDAQYKALMDYINKSIAYPPDYNLFNGQTCTDWVLQGLKKAEIIPDILAADPKFRTFIDTLIFNPYLQAIGFQLYNDFRAALRFVFRYDPLTLDLDGDGIETRALGQPSNSPVYFDFNGDGIKTNAAWVSPDDGYLVLDRNNNSTIDTASELFSDYTLLNAGGRAANGFAALAQEDINKDGVVNNLDANWNNLKIWRDINQDGMSQSDELLTMEQAGITGLNVAKTSTNQTLANGNSIKGTGTYIKADGTTGQMADVYFTVDTTNQQFTDTIPIVPEVEALPYMPGSGLVRDLHQAASISPQLANLLTQYSQATTRQEQMALIDQLLYAWADTSGMTATMDQRDPQHFRIQYNAFGSVSRYNNYVAGGGTNQYIPDEENLQLTESYRQLIAQWSQKLHILEAFNGQYFFAFPNQASAEGIGALTGMSVINTITVAGSQIKTLGVSFAAQQLSLFDQSYEALRQGVYETLFYQTRFQTVFVPLLDFVDYVWGEGGDGRDDGVSRVPTVDYSGLEQYFQNQITADPAAGMSDLLEFNRYVGNAYLPTDWKGNEMFADYCRNLPMTPDLQAIYNSYSKYLHILGGTTTYYQASNISGEEIIASQNTNTTIYGNTGDDIIIGGSGNDSLYGGQGDDNVYGGAGNDTLSGDAGNDVLRGGEGNDYIIGGADDDMLDGGAGNDTLYGGLLYTWNASGNGNDTYLFGRGSGQDTIVDRGTTASTADTILLDSDIAPTDVTLRRNYNDLVLSLNNTTDKLTVSSWFYEFGDYQVEYIQFGDGTMWDAATIKQMMLQGTSGDDTIMGYSTADTISGLEGDDQLSGYAGNDTLDGGAGNDSIRGLDGNDQIDGGEGDDTLFGDDQYSGTGADLLFGGSGDDYINGGYGNDTLYGGAGNDYLVAGSTGTGQIEDDVLIGGEGNDTLQGALGDDTYFFSRGDGADEISDLDYSWAMDALVFGEGITYADLDLTIKYTDSLWIGIKGTTDSILINSHFDDNDQHDINQFRFADGTVMTAAQIEANGFIIYGTSGNDSHLQGAGGPDRIFGYDGDDEIIGFEGNDTLDGGAGNDTLQAYDGNDALDGGVGNDYLWGGNGEDTYLFGMGSGADTINNAEYDEPGADDVVQFGEGITAADLDVSNSNKDLVINIHGTTDSITISDYFATSHKIAWYKFADNTILSRDQLEANHNFTIYGADSVNDNISGTYGNDTLDGGAGNDTFVVDNAGDSVIEAPNGGIDTVRSTDFSFSNLKIWQEFGLSQQSSGS